MNIAIYCEVQAQCWGISPVFSKHDMQHLNVFYIFITFLVGVVALCIGMIEYIKTRERFVLYYLYFHLALSLMVLSDLGISYISVNFPRMPTLIMDGLNYFRAFLIDNAVMLSFPVMMHEFFEVPSARQRNIIFGGLVALLFLGNHVLAFLYYRESMWLFGDNIEGLVHMLIFFYGFVMGISMFGQLQHRLRKRLARKVLILLGVSMPAIVIDTLLYDAFSAHFYPMIYCVVSLVFAHHLITTSLIRHQHVQTPPSEPSSCIEAAEKPVEKPPLSELDGREGSPDNVATFLTDELYQCYNLSPREQDVLPLLAQGASNKELSERLFISVSTVKTHLRNIYAKFGVKNRYELLAFLKHGDEALIPRSNDVESV